MSTFDYVFALVFGGFLLSRVIFGKTSEERQACGFIAACMIIPSLFALLT